MGYTASKECLICGKAIKNESSECCYYHTQEINELARRMGIGFTKALVTVLELAEHRLGRPAQNG